MSTLSYPSSLLDTSVSGSLQDRTNTTMKSGKYIPPDNSMMQPAHSTRRIQLSLSVSPRWNNHSRSISRGTMTPVRHKPGRPQRQHNQQHHYQHYPPYQRHLQPMRTYASRSKHNKPPSATFSYSSKSWNESSTRRPNSVDK